jgi:hypothetical protein
LLEIALWHYRETNRVHGSDPSDGAPLPEIEGLLAPLLTAVVKRQGRPRRDALAMLGRFVPQLYLLAPAWAAATSDTLFADGAADPVANPAWGAYLVRGGYSDESFKRLRSWYLRAAETVLRSGDPLAGDRDLAPSQGLAEHVLIAVLRGVAALGDADGLVEKTFSGVAAKPLRVRATRNRRRATCSSRCAEPVQSTP